MRIIVISDTHIPQTAKDIPQKIYDEIKNADLILHAGDITSLEFYNKLKALGVAVKAVRGNMDLDTQFKENIPEKELLKISKFKIGLTHGWGSPSGLLAVVEAEFKKDKPDVIVFGHSHQPLNLNRNGILFFNPGSPTDKIFSSVNTYGVINVNDKITGEIVEI